MKTRRRSKGSKGTQPRTKPRGRARRSIKLAGRPQDLLAGANRPVPSAPTAGKGCEEVEVGDIGGFGDPEELEAHEKRCGEKSTEFCQACGRSLCSIHFELLHRDHDTAREHIVGRSLTASN